MSTFEDIFMESHRQTESNKNNDRRKASKKNVKLTESKMRQRKKLQESLFDDVEDIRTEMGYDPYEVIDYRDDLGEKIVNMLNARVNNEMNIDNPGFKVVAFYKDDDFFTIEVEDGDGYVENGSARDTGDEISLIKAIVDNLMDNLNDGEYRGHRVEESEESDKELDDLSADVEGFIGNEEEYEPEFDPIDPEKLGNCDLLTAEDFEEYKDNIPAIDFDWWLQDATDGATKNVQYVDENNERVVTGKGIYDYLGVRPVVTVRYDVDEDDERFETDDAVYQFEIGEEFSFYGYDWVAFSEEKAICTGVIGTMDFDSVSNNYDRSLIKQFIHDWIGGYDISSYKDTDDEEEKDILDRNIDERDDGEFIIESNDDWVYGYDLQF